MVGGVDHSNMAEERTILTWWEERAILTWWEEKNILTWQMRRPF
jgi:hypothetical protein